MNPNLPNVPVPPHARPPQGKQRGKGCLYAFVGGLVVLFLMVACGALVSTASDPDPATPPSSGAGGKSGTPTGAKKSTKVTNGVGKEYRDGKFAFTVTKVKKGVRQVGGEYLNEKAQGQFVLIHVTVDNIGDKPRTFDSTNQTLTDVQGRKFNADTEAVIVMGEESKAFLEDINPGNSVQGVLVYDVPRGIRLKSVKLHDSMFSGGVTVPLGNR